MSNKFGVILKSNDNKYCVVVQRFYPNIKEVLHYCNLDIDNNDILAGLKLYREGMNSINNNDGRGLPISSTEGNQNLIVFGKSFNFKFGFPKGGRETENRTGIDCALRELKQETNITLDRGLIRRDNFIKTVPNFRRETTTYFRVDDYDGIQSIEALPEFQDEISEVLWLTIEQISNLPSEHCSNEFKYVVSQINGGIPLFQGPLPHMRLPPQMVDETEMDIFTRAVVKSFHLRIRGHGGIREKNDEFIGNLRRLLILTCEKNCAENEIKEIMFDSTCPVVKKK